MLNVSFPFLNEKILNLYQSILFVKKKILGFFLQFLRPHEGLMYWYF